MTRARWCAARAVALVAAVVMLLGCVPAMGDVHPDRKSRIVAPQARPNIVLVLMDDFSMDLLQTMKGARRLARRAATYQHFVVDSLCCVSRASLMTGQYPHQTGVRTNTASLVPGAGPMGGWPAFRAYGNEQRSVNVRLQAAGYTTGFVGKYLNQYEYLPGVKPLPPLPAGWSQFNALFGSAYDGWGFDSTGVSAGRLQARHHPIPPATASRATRDASYAGQVVEDYALDFIRAHRSDAAPYFLEVAPYAPHNRTNPQGAYPGDPVFPPAFRDRAGGKKAQGKKAQGKKAQGNCGLVSCRSLTTKDLPGFGDPRADNAPRTLAGRKARAWNSVPTLGAARATAHLRNRAQMVQSIDRTLRRILKAVDEDTVVVLTSDNGFHLGQLGLGMGKGTAYDTDIRVPLLIAGPGITPGARTEMTSNLDLAPTFEELAGLQPAAFRSGTSLVPTFTDPSLRTRDHVFVEHTTDTAGDDPDLAFTGGELKRIPSYVAVRSSDALLVRLDLDPHLRRTRYAYEFYSYAKRGWEKRNVVHQPRYAAQVAALRAKLEELDACATTTGDTAVSERCRRITQ
ncbi:sulfatase-like hydrolase/transferase [Nocardioides houyundeii]|uniref:sulfatase-like hydrolase/transferase n=1 Tax=Nocardioides houyundeii TaxID=2045452 RepID=UPI000DF458DE|nr:sulfatase-like hydrolase/transferase [Nocardioides houyundeii]